MNVARIGLEFFSTLGAPVRSGRSFHSGDIGGSSGSAGSTDAAALPNSGRPTIVVNDSFVNLVLGERSAVGRRVRYAARAGHPASPWYEIVGVVPDLGMIHDDPHSGAGIYHAVAPGAAEVNLAVHVKGDAGAFAARLRHVAAAVDPALRLHDAKPMDEVGATLWMEMDFLWRLLGLISLLALLLSLAGIYSVTSFTVSRRTREIGIRVALGAHARQIVVVIFARAFAQVVFGIGAGGAVVLVLTKLIIGLSPSEVAAIGAYMALMLLVCLLACILPTRRALSVEPAEALRTLTGRTGSKRHPARSEPMGREWP